MPKPKVLEKKITKIMRRRADRDLSHLLRIEAAARIADRAAKSLAVIADRETLKQFKDAATRITAAAEKLDLAEKHEIILSGPDGKSGMILKVCDLDDTVNGNAARKITGVVPDLSTLKTETEKDLRFVKRVGASAIGLVGTIIGIPLLWLLGNHPDLLAELLKSKSGVK